MKKSCVKKSWWVLALALVASGTAKAENLMYISWGDHIMVSHGIAQLDTTTFSFPGCCS